MSRVLRPLSLTPYIKTEELPPTVGQNSSSFAPATANQLPSITPYAEVKPGTVTPNSGQLKVNVSRNDQVSRRSMALIIDRANDRDPLQCQYCDHYQTNGRRCDLDKHIKTHTRHGDIQSLGHDWVCCGVPVHKAKEYGVTADLSAAKHWRDDLMIGGCWHLHERTTLRVTSRWVDALVVHTQDGYLGISDVSRLGGTRRYNSVVVIVSLS